jgi:predicted TIM-barrel fold metal-dependent hydrolase
MNAIREIRRCIGELGFGRHSRASLAGIWPTDRRFYPVYAACCELTPFCTQIGHTGPLMSSKSGVQSISIVSRWTSRS